MNSDLLKLLLVVCHALNKNKVQYLIVGGTAVALHGYYRGSINLWGDLTSTPDLDFWYNPTYDNYFRLLNALEDLGQNVQEFKEEQSPNPKKSFFKYHFEKFTFDLLPQIKAPLTFRDAFRNKNSVNEEGTAIYFIGFDDLIKDKEATARVKDIDDVQQLRNNQRKNEG